MDCLGTPNRFASLSNEPIIHKGKSTLTLLCSCAGLFTFDISRYFEISIKISSGIHFNRQKYLYKKIGSDHVPINTSNLISLLNKPFNRYALLSVKVLDKLTCKIDSGRGVSSIAGSTDRVCIFLCKRCSAYHYLHISCGRICF